MANVDVKAQIDRLNKKSAAASSRLVSFEPAGNIMEPKVRAAAVPHVHGPGAVSVDKDHIWAFFDSSYTAVNLTTARVACNQDRTDKGRMWMGIVFDEQLVYKPGEGQTRSSLRRATQRDPILKMYQEDMGSLGGRFTGLKGHMTLTYALKRTLGDDAEFYKKVMDIFTRYLRSQHDNDNPEWLPWINKIPLGATRYRSGVTPRVTFTSRHIGATIIT